MVTADKTQMLRNALAEWFECEPEQIGNFVIGCERQTETGVTFSSVYTTLAHWYLLGFVDELRSHIEQLRGKGEANGEVASDN